MRAWSDSKKAGRLDINGQEWWACDPYPTWFRWEGEKLLHGPSGPWAADQDFPNNDKLVFDVEIRGQYELDVAEIQKDFATKDLSQILELLREDLQTDPSWYAGILKTAQSKIVLNAIENPAESDSDQLCL
jgi:hypothetical protein